MVGAGILRSVRASARIAEAGGQRDAIIRLPWQRVFGRAFPQVQQLAQGDAAKVTVREDGYILNLVLQCLFPAAEPQLPHFHAISIALPPGAAGVGTRATVILGPPGAFGEYRSIPGNPRPKRRSRAPSNAS